MLKYLAAILLLAGEALAQQYELGATIGYGFYNNGTIFSASGSAEAVFETVSRPALFSPTIFRNTSPLSLTISTTTVIPF